MEKYSFDRHGYMFEPACHLISVTSSRYVEDQGSTTKWIVEIVATRFSVILPIKLVFYVSLRLHIHLYPHMYIHVCIYVCYWICIYVCMCRYIDRHFRYMYITKLSNMSTNLDQIHVGQMF